MTDELHGRRKRGLPTKAKAKEIVRHGEVRGHELTEKQHGLMGMIAGGKTPYKSRRRRGKK